MIDEPEFTHFAERYARGEAQPVTARLVSDLETPVSAYVKIRPLTLGRPSFLLESVEGGANRGRYSILGLLPDRIWRCEGPEVEIADETGAFEPVAGPPLAALRAFLAKSAVMHVADLPPMACGVFGYLGYEMVREMEHLAPAKPDPIGVPDSLLIRPSLVLVFDTVKDEIVIVTPVRPEAGIAAAEAFAAARARLGRVIDALEGPLPQGAAGNREARLPELRSNTSEAAYLAQVARAKRYILDGDIFQVVLSQRFSSPFDLDSLALYRALRRVNPSPYLAYLDFGAFQIVCSSPEILVRAVAGKLTIRPIAGTRPRGRTREEDLALEAELLADPKERAEHLMLLDLGRNDAGRVARIGSVDVKAQFFIERYSQVMHIVSEVEAELGEGHDAIDALSAGFPAGTVTGAPKIRAMEIIDELEQDRRGVYAGAIGYFGADGAMDTCIVLRTALLKDGVMHVQAGAGIVHESIPEAEAAECRHKARALFRAAEEAVRFASLPKRGQ